MLKKLKKIKNDKKGAVSIMMVIFILTLVASLSLLIDLSGTMFGMKEVQSKIDIAGINALYNSIDATRLRNEEMGIISNGGSISSSGNISSEVSTGAFADIIRREYIDELNQIRYPGETPMVRSARVSFEHSNFGLGFNSASNSTGAKNRPQIVLESIVSYDVPSSAIVDRISKSITKKVNSVHSNSEFKVTIEDVASDGMKTVLVHSITRLVLK